MVRVAKGCLAPRRDAPGLDPESVQLASNVMQVSALWCLLAKTLELPHCGRSACAGRYRVALERRASSP